MAQHYKVAEDSHIFRRVVQAWHRAFVSHGIEIGYQSPAHFDFLSGHRAHNGFLDCTEAEYQCFRELLDNLDSVSTAVFRDAREEDLP